MKILVTGGAGYIGSHTCIELLNANYDVIVLDNLCNSSKESLKRVQELTGKSVEFYETDLLNKTDIAHIFSEHKIDAVIHFAGLKAVGESVSIPLKYFQNNITGTLNLLEVMNDFTVKNIVFSSSATVYGDPASLPITEDFPLSATNPYGRTKLMIEQILQDLYISDNTWNIALLRYFNPVGAHKSGRIGEDPFDIPNNLVPYITQVAVGSLKELQVFGNDYDTPDGTGVRDYIHVVDLALGHIKTLPKLFTHPGVVIYNLGTGKGYSVLDMVKGFEKASSRKIAYKIVNRRPGDIAACWADPAKAKRELGWEAQKSLEDMCNDSWNWQKNNPQGYRAK
ncbi:MAG: UDP-glucose 4-epimerase GalE [Proteobacteria bacterium]|nr:UDP-glucose 4-epimerase GalE [Pseudomonadota bacterium]MBU1389651.1 UDP-glucose 4-epimerase GalE [Pseudomonadota bacterium]MBU1542589.1 UDP-glucose 4-epimerase GalE [Pseudomonadota bacterium]MBU2483048.1 UDP-glucose 4-epimerase GalE [Pseudomonadota bacterium]